MRKTSASLLASSAVALAQASGRRYSPTPDHPRTAAWYAKLRKPSATPPGPVFGAVWTGLDGLLAYSGTRLLAAEPSLQRTVALGFWGLNVLGVAGFPWVLFGRRQLGAATGVTVAMLATSGGAVATAAGVDRRAAWAGVPLAGWVLFASFLQEEVWRRNR
ncbi:TspO/MBR family protein [Lichenicoccus roseus]|uniref:Tryptophan-rich sensory protein n=1 Tax=Lichenicoccus roseus TaxID=2683649 RepID=A0A5R9J9R6_9PROT|nr:TspO/MBR family protein [Lichenicoccus roseus]TLU72341.1 tryptophan-rich sensory protein [Lichenicoccus roseus]